ncbi:hypothetical protein ACFYPC_34025 [Streptomyces sp. NPDC005808]|uniref:hypothetical protein n=1 Tax=Streptomyces sp. NPDC005808 TaxID=3364734 RepID=UPI0036D166DC
MSRPISPLARRHRLTALAIGVSLASTLTACSYGQTGITADDRGTPSSTESSPKGVVTPEFADSVLSKYVKANNAANKALDAKLLATVEAGQLNVQSAADYQQWKTWSKEDQTEYGSPFTYTAREYWIPPAGTATWFAATAISTWDDKNPAVLIFDRVDGTYKMVGAFHLDETPIPEIAVDRNGLAEAVDPGDRVGTLAPDSLAPALQDLFETGGKKEGSALTSTPAKKSAVKVYTDRNTGENADSVTTTFFSAKPTHPTVYTLRLADGGALSVFPTALTRESILKPQYMSSFQLTPTAPEAIYDDSKRVVITDELQGQALARLTPSGDPSLIAYRDRMVDSR